MKAKVLGHFAETDEWEPLEYVEKTMEQVRKPRCGRDASSSTRELPIGSWNTTAPNSTPLPLNWHGSGHSSF